MLAVDPAAPCQAMARYTLHVNERSHVVEATPDTPLLWILRDHLGLTGTKYGCGTGVCGACTVHVDSTPERSCRIPVAELGRRKVLTIEGLDPKGEHPLQRAWVELDVPQCGYCQPGMIMSAAALLARHPRPSDMQIDEALAGHVCRCATYLRIRQGIRRAIELAQGKGGRP
jgi:isoquinoline 1-oxidoreductase alpha subunit